MLNHWWPIYRGQVADERDQPRSVVAVLKLMERHDRSSTVSDVLSQK